MKQVVRNCVPMDEVRPMLQVSIRSCQPYSNTVLVSNVHFQYVCTYIHNVHLYVHNCLAQASRCTLHLAADLPPMAILDLVLTIHGAHSMPWQIMYCTVSTTKHELTWFFERVKVFKLVQHGYMHILLLVS